jgi:hypothetical protein
MNRDKDYVYCNNYYQYGGIESTKDGKIEIVLKDWEEFTNFTIQITPIDNYSNFFTSEFDKGKFVVHGDGKFYWCVNCILKPVDDDTFIKRYGW